MELKGKRVLVVGLGEYALALAFVEHLAANTGEIIHVEND